MYPVLPRLCHQHIPQYNDRTPRLHCKNYEPDRFERLTFGADHTENDYADIQNRKRLFLETLNHFDQLFRQGPIQVLKVSEDRGQKFYVLKLADNEHYIYKIPVKKPEVSIFGISEFGIQRTNPNQPFEYHPDPNDRPYITFSYRPAIPWEDKAFPFFDRIKIGAKTTVGTPCHYPRIIKTRMTPSYRNILARLARVMQPVEQAITDFDRRNSNQGL